MIKKIILIISILFLSGCTLFSINSLSVEQIIDRNISEDNNLYNVNNKGYRYFLPMSFSVYSDEDYNQILISNGIKYYLNVDIVSYFYKNQTLELKDVDDYIYYSFSKNEKSGYLKIKKNNDYFFIELCYNYAIIEVEVEEKDIKYAVTSSISILNSIKYNDVIINKQIDNTEIETSETIYKIPSPENSEENKNILEYIESAEAKDAE